MNIRSLDNTPIDDIIACFIIAFKGYFVKMPTDPGYYKKRWKATGVQWDRSYGMFVKNELVAFILTAIDEREGGRIAYNAGSGVIPEYRGQRIIKAIYEYALPIFRENGISKCVLEVIKENKVALRSYESIGFNICKSYKCFGGEIAGINKAGIVLKELTYQDVDWSRMGRQDLYSWDNHRHSLKNGYYRYFQVLNGVLPESFFVIDITSGYVPQLEALGIRPLVWERLFQAIRSLSSSIKINNVDEILTEKLKALESAGLENTIDQYEMELDLAELN